MKAWLMRNNLRLVALGFAFLFAEFISFGLQQKEAGFVFAILSAILCVLSLIGSFLRIKRLRGVSV